MKCVDLSLLGKKLSSFKLKAHDIGNDVINRIEEWLTHRRQRVIVDGEISN